MPDIIINDDWEVLYDNSSTTDTGGPAQTAEGSYRFFVRDMPVHFREWYYDNDGKDEYEEGREFLNREPDWEVW